MCSSRPSRCQGRGERGGGGGGDRGAGKSVVEGGEERRRQRGHGSAAILCQVPRRPAPCAVPGSLAGSARRHSEWHTHVRCVHGPRMGRWSAGLLGLINRGIVLGMEIAMVWSIGWVLESLHVCHACMLEASGNHADSSLRAAGVEGTTVNWTTLKISAGPPRSNSRVRCEAWSWSDEGLRLCVKEEAEIALLEPGAHKL